ncbi:MAG TPA: hypothetical protein VFR90_13530 [Methylibium sp.]|uniref:hypothetical protein n=1 Tax=Methylibium sp. TaxID=2067992 RepID=UPI002DBE75C8|nr:hypothetical protein [Methylibium sp.]HEU4460138.1 hypothetical protein [Methylibium sp.]
MKRWPPRWVVLLALLAVVGAGVLWDGRRPPDADAFADVADAVAATRAAVAATSAPAAIEIAPTPASARDPFYDDPPPADDAGSNAADERWPRVVGLAWREGRRWLVVELPDAPARLVRPGVRFGAWRIDGHRSAEPTLIHLPTGASRPLNLHALNEAPPVGGVIPGDETF